MNNIFVELIEDIEFIGDVSQPRDLKVKELLLHDIIIDPTTPFANFNSRSFNWKYFAGELVWYLNKDTNIEYINKFSGFWKNITNPNSNEINSNYGSLLFGNQLKWVVDSLIQDKNSRQAIAFLNQPKYQFKDNKDFVCTMYLNFFIRNNRLNMKVQMRSNDIFYGLTFDAPFFALVHQHVYLWLREKYSDLELGEYFHFADNIHFYERHFDLANQILSEWENPKEVYSNEYEMILQKPLFNINEDGSITYTTECNEMMARINKAVENEDTKQIDYYNILAEYLNILIS